MRSSAEYGDALAAELPAILGRASAIAPNRVQNGSQRGEDPGCGSRRRRLAVEAVRKLAALWAAGTLGQRQARAWFLYFVHFGPDARAAWAAGKPDALATRVHLLALDRGERVHLLAHRDGPDGHGCHSAGIGLVRGAEVAFDDVSPIDSGGVWFTELVERAQRATHDLEEDERIAKALRANRRAQRKAARKERAA